MATLARRTRRTSEIWPGFVDALATLLMVIIFLLMIFVLAQFFLNEALSGRDAALVKLQSQIDELADLLALERGANVNLRLDFAQLSEELQASVATRDELTTRVESLSLNLSESEARSTAMSRELDDAFKTIMANKGTIEAQASELATLSNQIAALRALKESLEQDVGSLSQRLQDSETARAETEEALAASQAEVSRSTSALSDEREISETARAQVALLDKQMAALRAQLRQLAGLLDASESLAEQHKVQISSLGRRLNAALASRVQELARYRSEFFGRLREVLGDRPGVRIVGDRFVFQSEVLFATGSAEIGPAGRGQIEQFAATLREVAQRIPAEIDWILRVDGHTDAVPIRTAQYPSNWELSTARATSVVKFLTDLEIPANRLAATGFGEFQPLDPGRTEAAYRRNRRIELKLTQR
ncbi:MAG: peptidoglycan -binding protein [Rhodospirillales bacterium]|jgi:chemotaxis protein MotB|nr:peptidoglycan -binding protein [Rhodospirillales bacterium]